MKDNENKVAWLDFNDAADQTDDFEYDNSIIQSEPQAIESNPFLLKTYLNIVFGYCDEGWIALRSFPEKNKSNRPHNIWVKNNDSALDKIINFAKWTDDNGYGCYCIPCLMYDNEKAKSEDVVQSGVLLIDIDSGDINKKLKYASTHIGLPSLVVKSGGVTDEGQDKIHAYWKLSEPADGEELKSLASMRHQLALKIGADTSFRSLHQPIRLAGSIHHKSDRRLVDIQDHNSAEYHLPDLIDLINQMRPMDGIEIDKIPTESKTPNFMDFNDDSDEKTDINVVLTTPVREGGQDGATRFDRASSAIGHFIRLMHDGKMSRDDGWNAIQGFNNAILRPPWPIDRLSQESDALWVKHCLENGPAKQYSKKIASSEDIQFLDMSDWDEKPPQREWIIQDWLPKGYVTAIYGDGGVGKSLLVQQLMTCLASGKPWLDLMLKKQRVYGLLCEDDDKELRIRQYHINKNLGLKMKDIRPNLRLVSRVGMNNLLMTFDGKDTGQLSEFFDNLLNSIMEFQPTLIVLDTAADLFGGNENNRAHVRQFVQNACARLARETNGSVLLCAHPSDSGLKMGTGKGGSTAWNNTVRSRWYLQQTNDEDTPTSWRYLSRKKANYSASGDDMVISWENGSFVTVDVEQAKQELSESKKQKMMKKKEYLHQAIIDLILKKGLEGKLFTQSQFSKTFKNTDDFGSETVLKREITNLALEGKIMFFQNIDQFNLPKVKTGNGYLWVDNLKTVITSADCGDQFIEINPSHYLCSKSRICMPISDQFEGENNDEI